jgi:hypothetical protein
MTVQNNLSGLPATASDAETINGVIQPAFKKLKEVVSRLPRHLCRGVIELPELIFIHSIESTQLLLLPQPESVFADFYPPLSMLTGTMAFPVEGTFLRVTSVALEEKLGPLRPAQATN